MALSRALELLLAEAQRRGLVTELSTPSDDRWGALVARVRRECREFLVAEQLAFFEDPGRWKVACAARQSGKTATVARLLVDVALSGPNKNCAYVSDTSENARKVMWADQVDGLPAVLRSLGMTERVRASDLDWDYRINLTTLTVTFRNGSVVYLTSAEGDSWAAFRGQKLDLIVADEMQRQDQDALEHALEADLKDCLVTRQGTFVGIGTVGRALKGVWYELSALGREGWTRHSWTAKELSHVTDVWENQLAEALAMGVDPETDSTFLREKRAVWVRDGESLVHTVTDACLWDGVTRPELVRSRCLRHYGPGWFACTCPVPLVRRSEAPVRYAGLDLGGGDAPGQGDPNGVVVVDVSLEEGVIRELHSEQRWCVDSDELGRWLRGLQEKFDVATFYVDPAWKQTKKDLGFLQGVRVSNADKGDKDGKDEDFWHSERRTAFRQGTFVVVRGGALHGQLETVLRDPKELERGRIRQAPGQEDHVLDAARYVFRMIRTNHVRCPEAPLTPMEREIQSELEFRKRVQSPVRSVGTPGRRPIPGVRR